MHVRAIHLKYFKRFRERILDFADPETGRPRDLIVLVGGNGSGKSTVLQAIAAALGTATRRLESPDRLAWPGFDLALAGNAWRTPYEATVTVQFSSEEIDATSSYFKSIPNLAARADAVPPGSSPMVELVLREGRVRAGNQAEYFQFRGREYAKQVLKFLPEGHDVFRRVGNVFWYTEYRNATSLTVEGENGEPLHLNEDLLRRRLADFMQFHLRIGRGEYELRAGQRDFFAELERAYKTVFPNRAFEGPVPRSGAEEVLDEPWFYLYDSAHQYEVSEMSGGERAIFPIIFDFANLNIHNSVILIDELELHLHPPLQQALIRALRGLGTNNQFVVTTHSDWVTQVVPPECVVRLEPLP